MCRQGVGGVLRRMEPEAALPPLPKDLWSDGDAAAQSGEDPSQATQSTENSPHPGPRVGGRWALTVASFRR